MMRHDYNSPLEEPLPKKAQYEMSAIETEWGDKVRIKVFSGISDLEKRKFYTEFCFPIDSKFAEDLLEILKDVKSK